MIQATQLQTASFRGAGLPACRRASARRSLYAATIALAAISWGCGGQLPADPTAEAPPPVTIEHAGNPALLHVDHPEQFPAVEAGKVSDADALSVTGTVTPDVSRNIPVVSLASGRVIEINAKLGDTVERGQVLLKIQSADVSGSFAAWRSATADEKLAHNQLDRAKLLFGRGALAQKDLEVAEDTESKAKISVENALDQIRVLGADVNHPSPTIDIVAPATGVITEQNVNDAGGVKTLDNSPNLFTISDLSTVWVLCDVYENDLASVRNGENVDIRFNAYPDKVFKGRVGAIGPILDPNTRTAKVRVELKNPGIMRIGMFVTAEFHGPGKTDATVPATAVLHLHDRDWVYEPAGGNNFRRVEVKGGAILPSKAQIITFGIAPGDRVVANALEMQNTVEQ